MNSTELLAIVTVCVTVAFVAAQVLTAVRLKFRAENIKVAGWPPRSLDADGDWQPEYYDDHDVYLLERGAHPIQSAASMPPINGMDHETLATLQE